MAGRLKITGVGDCEQCEFEEILIGSREAIPLLPAGIKVLKPCTQCGTTARDAMADTERLLHENEIAFARYLDERLTVLYHWAPIARRKQILRFGLRPSMKPTTHAGDPKLGQKWRARYVCFADTPSWAWKLSAGVTGSPIGEWDLWQVQMDKLKEPTIIPMKWSNGIHEVRTEHRVYKRDLWYVGTRTKSG